MQPCSHNSFCKSLPQETRTKLCRGCRQHLQKAGSIQLQESFEREVTIIIDGALVCSQASLEKPGDWKSVSVFVLCLPGSPLSLETTFLSEHELSGMAHMYNYMACMTDCLTASFDHKLFIDLFEHDKSFADALMQSVIQLLLDVSRFTALLRLDSVQSKVAALVGLLSEHDVYLSRADVAKVLGCNRVSVSRAFSQFQEAQPESYAAYVQNKGRPVNLYRA